MANKLFYTVGDIAEELGEEPYRIRYWCDQVPEIEPERSPGGQRQFREEDLTSFRRIQHLVDEENLTLEGARERLKNRNQHPEREELPEKIIDQCNQALSEIDNFMENL